MIRSVHAGQRHVPPDVAARLAEHPRVDLHAYSNNPNDDAVTARLRGLFAHWHTIAALDDLQQQLPGIAVEDGPSFTVLRVDPETGFLRTPPMTYEGPEMKYRFGRALERRFGIEVFGPQGY